MEFIGKEVITMANKPGKGGTRKKRKPNSPLGKKKLGSQRNRERRQNDS